MCMRQIMLLRNQNPHKQIALMRDFIKPYNKNSIQLLLELRYSALDELKYDLDKQLEKRTHQEKNCQGMTPMEYFEKNKTSF